MHYLLSVLTNRAVHILASLIAINVACLFLMKHMLDEWTPHNHFFCRLDSDGDLRLYAMDVGSELFLSPANKNAGRDVVFAVDVHSNIWWDVSCSCVDIDGALDICGVGNCDSAGRVLVLLDNRIAEGFSLELLTRFSEKVDGEVYIVGLDESRAMLPLANYSLKCIGVLTNRCHAKRYACTKWSGMPIRTNKAFKVFQYLHEGSMICHRANMGAEANIDNKGQQAQDYHSKIPH